jgi:hypothetical protein
MPRAHRRIDDLQGEDFRGRLSFRLGLQGLADEEVDEGTIRVVAAGLLASQSALYTSPSEK